MQTGKTFEPLEFGIFAPGMQPLEGSPRARSATSQRASRRSPTAAWAIPSRSPRPPPPSPSRLPPGKPMSSPASTPPTPTVPGAARGVGAPRSQRRLARLRAGVVGGARLRLPLRVPRPAAPRDRRRAPRREYDLGLLTTAPASSTRSSCAPGGRRHREPLPPAQPLAHRGDPRTLGHHRRRHAQPSHRPGDGPRDEPARAVPAHGVPRTRERPRPGRRGSSSPTRSPWPRYSSTSTTP